MTCEQIDTGSDAISLARWSEWMTCRGASLTRQAEMLRLTDDSHLCKLRKDPRYVVLDGAGS